MNAFTIRFDSAHACTAVVVPPTHPPAQALADLHLPPYNSVIVIHGGAGNMELSLINAVREFLIASLAPFAEKHRILLIDGATQSGVARILGDAREQTRGTFPLLGVMPHRFALYPGGPPLDALRTAINPAHSHLIFVEGDEWGAESELLVGLLRATGKPGLALIVNGGQIVLNEARRHAELDNRVVAIRGSGRTADQLARPNSEERRSLPPGAAVHVVDLDQPEALTAELARLLVAPMSA